MVQLMANGIQGRPAIGIQGRPAFDMSFSIHCCPGALHVPTAEALIAPVVVAMTNMVGRVELLTWLKPVVPHIPGGEVRVE